MTAKRLGHYELLGRLGEGGMGEVWKAYDPKLQRTVAIKVLHETDDASSRILAEARAASALNHNHICTIHEVGEFDGISFIVMEHVEGKPLSELIPSDGLPPESVIRYGTQIADALAHAHEHGIVHRDLKSANVVITPEAQVKLIDFGIAVPLPQVDAEAVTRTMESPVSSAPAGTLAYMAPEVLNGQEATARSDIWSLGVLLYEMASGRLPFEGETPLDVVSAIAKETPKALPSRVSAGLRGIVQRCLQKEPGSRYSAAVAVESALETIQSDVSSVPAALSAGRARRPASIFIGVGLVGVVALALGYFLRPGVESRSTGATRLSSPTQATTTIEAEDYPTLSPDGQMVAYQRGEVGGRDIWVSQIGEGQAVNRTDEHPGDDVHPSWSPDGRQIAFWSARDGGGVYVMAVLAGSARRVVASAGGNGVPRMNRPQWSPDGAEIAVYQADNGDAAFIEIVSLDGSTSRRLSMPGTQKTFRQDMSWSPDGQFIAYQDGSHGWEVNGIWLVRVADGEAFALTDGLTNDLSPT